MKKQTLFYLGLLAIMILALGVTPVNAAEAQINNLELDKSNYELGETIQINASWYLQYYTYEGWSHGEISYSTSQHDPAIDGTYWQNEHSGQVHTHSESYQLKPSDWSPGLSGQLGVARAIAIANDYMGSSRDDAYLNFTVYRAGQNYSIIPASQPPLVNETVEVEYKIFNEHDENLTLPNHNITYLVYKEELTIKPPTNTTTETNGHLNVTFDAFGGEGNYSIQVYSFFDDDYEDLNFTETIYVYQNYTKRPTHTHITPQQALTFSSLNTTTRVEDNTHDPIPHLLVEINLKINNTWTSLGSAITQSDGNARIISSIDFAAGIYPLRAKTPGNGFYQSSENITTLLVLKRNTSLIVTNQTASSTDCIEIPIQLIDQEQNPIPNKTIVGSIQQGLKWDTFGSDKTNLTGYAILIFNATYSSDNYTAIFTFNTTNFYHESQKTIKIHITLESTQINVTPIQIYFSQPFQVWGVIIDDDNTPVPSQNLSLWLQEGLNWQYLQANISNLTGIILFNVNLNLDPGNYTLKVEFNGTTTYRSSSTLVALTIHNASTSIQCTPIPTPVYIFDDQIITVTLQDQDLNQLPNQTIQIIEKRNGITIQETIIQTNSTGRIVYIVTLPTIEELSLLFVFNGTHQYLSCNSTLTIQPQRHQTKLELDIPSIIPPHTPMVINITLTIDDTSPHQTHEVQLCIRSTRSLYVNQSLVTDLNGRTYLTWTPIQEQSYDIMVSYTSKTGEFTNTTITITVNVEKIIPIFSLKIDQQQTQLIIQLNLTNSQGEPISNAEIDWYINNTLIQTTVTNIDGNTELRYNPTQSGTYQLIVKYEGSRTTSSHSLETSVHYQTPPEIEYTRIGILVMILIPITAILTKKIRSYRSETELILSITNPS